MVSAFLIMTQKPRINKKQQKDKRWIIFWEYDLPHILQFEEKDRKFENMWEMPSWQNKNCP